MKTDHEAPLTFSDTQGRTFALQVMGFLSGEWKTVSAAHHDIEYLETITRSIQGDHRVRERLLRGEVVTVRTPGMPDSYFRFQFLPRMTPATERGTRGDA